MTGPVRLDVNGREVEVDAAPASRLTRVLRDHLGLTGTKVGCDAGDCGACTVLLDGEQVCACLVSLGQVAGRSVATVESLAENGRLSRLQQAFLAHGAAQCGICTPGMLMAASTLLDRGCPPNEPEVLDALGGVLCRCTGYRKIVRAVLAATNGADTTTRNDGATRYMGRRIPSVDGIGKVTGKTVFGADEAPGDTLALRVVRSPHPHARFTLGDCTALHARHPGLTRVLTSADVPGVNGFGIYPDIKDQPVLAPGIARYRGEAVVALVGRRRHPRAALGRRDPHRLGAAAGAARPARRGGAGSRGRAAESPRQRAHPRPRAHAGEVPPAGCDGLIEAERRVRDSLHRARLHRAGGGVRARTSRAIASRCRPAPRRRTWTGTRWPTCSASRPNACASGLRPAAAASAASSTSPSSLWWRWPRGCSGCRCVAPTPAPSP